MDTNVINNERKRKQRETFWIFTLKSHQTGLNEGLQWDVFLIISASQIHIQTFNVVITTYITYMIIRGNVA